MMIVSSGSRRIEKHFLLIKWMVILMATSPMLEMALCTCAQSRGHGQVAGVGWSLRSLPAPELAPAGHGPVSDDRLSSVRDQAPATRSPVRTVRADITSDK